MQSTQMISLLGLLCAASCFINWLAAQHPNGGRLMISIYILLILFGGLSLVLDDPIARMAGIKTEQVHVGLAALAAAAVVGGAWVWFNKI